MLYHPGDLASGWLAMGHLIVRSRTARPGIVKVRAPWVGGYVHVLFLPMDVPPEFEDWVVGGAMLLQTQRGAERSEWLRTYAALLDDDVLMAIRDAIRFVLDGRHVLPPVPPVNGTPRVGDQ